MLGKIKLEHATQEPQWAHIILDITPRGFSTGLLKHNEMYFEKEIKLENGKTISEYYQELLDSTNRLGLPISIHTRPQEMETTTPFEEDVEHHHYDEDVATEILTWFQFAWDVEQQFIAPFRQRK